MFPKLLHIVNSVIQGFTTLLDWFGEANLYFGENFGPMGQLTFNLVLFSFLFLILFKVSKATLNFVFYVILPSLALSFLASFVLPYTLVTVLPFCVGLLIVVNLVTS